MRYITLLRKIIQVSLIKDDIDWLWERAYYCLGEMSKCECLEDKKHYWLMFNCYWDLYQQNKGEFYGK